MTPPDSGSFPLSGVPAGATTQLPNVSVAFPGEHWSDGKASVAIDPGSCIVPLNSGGKMFYAIAASGTLDPRAAIALRPVMIPDVNIGSPYAEALGPNEIVNRVLNVGEYVHAYYSGSFHLTLVHPDNTYGPGDLVGWDPLSTRPTGKAQTNTTGAWKKGVTAAQAMFEVQQFRPYSADGTEGVLTVRSLRGQF